MGKPAPSASDLLSLFITEVQTRRPDLAFLDGDVSEAMGYGAVAMADAIIGWASVQIRNLFFGGAVGEDLDTIIMDRLGLAREPASRAYGEVTFTRGSGPAGNAGTIAAGTQIGTAIAADETRNIVTTDTDLSIPTGPGTWTVGVTASDYGRNGNCQSGTLRQIIDQVLGGDSTLTVDNAEEIAGGNDSQSDEDYAAAARQLWLTMVRGTLSALETGALTVSTVRVAIATENLATGISTVSVSDADGNSNGRMLYDVAKALEEWRAAGALVNEAGGVRADLRLTISIDEYERGFDVAAAAEAIQAAVTNRVNQLRVGQDLTFDSLTAAVMQPFGTSITEVSFSAVTLTVRGVASVISDPQRIRANGSLIRLGATPTIVDGAA